MASKLLPLFHTETKSVSPGDVLSDGRFQMLAKIGRGAFSSVWVAESTTCDGAKHGQRQLVALKIIEPWAESGNAFEYRLAKKEVAKLRCCLDGASQNDAAERLLLPQEVFEFESQLSQQRHSALVFDWVCGPSVFEYAKGCKNGALPWSMGKRAIADAIAALDFLHQHSIGHGDLHTRNLLLVASPDPSQWLTEEVLAYAAARPLAVRPSKLTRGNVEPMMHFLQSKGMFFSGSIKISDFGSAFVDAASASSTPVRFVVKAPERWQGQTFGLPSDIWSLACGIVEIVSGASIFDTAMDLNTDPEGFTIRDRMREICSDVEQPNTARLKSELRNFWTQPALANGVSVDELARLEELLLQMLRLDPKDRLTIEQVARIWKTIH